MVNLKINSQLRENFLELGFIQYRPKSIDFHSLVSELYAYYSENPRNEKFEFAFRNAEGISRHIIDIFRDPCSRALDLYKQQEIVQILELLSSQEKFGYFTHSKLSYKEPYKVADWHPHQDNGYKNRGDIKKGFAIFICLEAMDESNGCLSVYPKSHLFGTLHHERVIEDIFTGDNQLCIANMDIAIEPISLFAQMGDIIVFHNDLIHQSGSSTCNSKRLALIAEVEFGDELKLDDYGLPAIHFKGNKNYYNSVILQFKSLFSTFRLWRLIKRYFPSLGRLIRKIRYKQSFY